MLTVRVVISSALVIVLIAAVLNRRRDSAPCCARTSGADDGSLGGLLVMSGDGASDCVGSDAAAAVTVAEVASRPRGNGDATTRQLGDGRVSGDLRRAASAGRPSVASSCR